MTEPTKCINCSFRELKKLDDLNCMFLGEGEECDNPVAFKLMMPGTPGEEELAAETGDETEPDGASAPAKPGVHR